VIAPALVEAAVDALIAQLGAAYVRTDETSRTTYGTDALKRGRPADVVVFPSTTEEVAAVVRICAERRIPIVPRGGGTGYTGGSVPLQGGVVLSLERMNRILEIDEANLLAIVGANYVLQEGRVGNVRGFQLEGQAIAQFTLSALQVQ